MFSLLISKQNEKKKRDKPYDMSESATNLWQLGISLILYFSLASKQY